MKRIPYATLLVIVVLMFLPGRASAQCGVERWSVKTGTDSDAVLVNLNSAAPTTMNSLLALPRPALIPDNQRLVPTETILWTMPVTLNGYFLAQDSDYHMVLTDGSGRTMIAEIPSPTCVGPGSPFAAGIAHARTQMSARFPPAPPGILQTLNIPVQLTGVGFFDFIGGQTGQAPNGIELHPVIDIVFNPSFSLSASPAPLSISQGTVANTTINLSGNLNALVALSASGLPPGATASFSPSSLTSPGPDSSTLSISVGPSAPIGTYNVLVSGTGGGQTHSTTINLTVNNGSATQQLLGNPGFENGSGSPAPWTVTSGVIDNSTFEASHTGSWKAWLNGYGSVHTDSILQQVSIPSTAAQVALSFWLHIDTTETTTTTAYDTLKVQLRNSSGTVLTTLATYSNLNAASGYAQVSFDISAYKGQTIQVYLVGVEDSSLKTSFVVDDFALNATTSGGVAADFAIAASPTALTIARSNSSTSTITTTVTRSFNSAIALSASGLPTGTTASFAPASIAAPGAGSSTLTITVGSATAVGTYPVTVNGIGGTLVVNFDAARFNVGATTATMSTGEVHTITQSGTVPMAIVQEAFTAATQSLTGMSPSSTR